MLALEDEKFLAFHMGRHPRGVLEVVARCPVGHPAVVTTYPLRRIKNVLKLFPTYYWLVCPRQCQELSHLERDGGVHTLENELERDLALQASLRLDHQRYVANRWKALSVEDAALLSQSGLSQALVKRGIGGMANFMAIKCLHMHMAQHLVEGNAIGSLLVQRYGLVPCEHKTGKPDGGSASPDAPSAPGRTGLVST